MLKKTEIIRRLKKNYAYTLKQLQRDFGIHPQTVRRYIKDSDNPLRTISENPTLIFSETLRAYFKVHVEERKMGLSIYEFYCMGCKEKHMAFENKVAAVDMNKNTKTHKALCPKCFAMMNKFQSSKRLTEVMPLFEMVSLEDLHILQGTHNPVKAHKGKKGKTGQKERVIKPIQENLFTEAKNG
ncbi:MAG: hypothetical protein ACTSXQ_05015 [Alphaproteobacteria bacterium]